MTVSRRHCRVRDVRSLVFAAVLLGAAVSHAQGFREGEPPVAYVQPGRWNGEFNVGAPFQSRQGRPRVNIAPTWQHIRSDKIANQFPAVWDEMDRAGQVWCWFTNGSGAYAFHFVGMD